MPALPAIAGVLDVKLIGTLEEDVDCVTRFFMDIDGHSTSSVTINNFAAHVAGNWGLWLQSHMAPDYILKEIIVTDLSSPSAPVGIWSGTAAGTYAETGDVPGAAAARINFTIARRYRGGHPGVFIPLTDTTQLSDSQTIDSTYAGALQTAWTNFMNDNVGSANGDFGGGCFWVTVSYYEGYTNFTRPSGRVVAIPKLRAGGPVVDVVTGSTINPRPASQRRRNLTRT